MSKRGKYNGYLYESCLMYDYYNCQYFKALRVNRLIRRDYCEWRKQLNNRWRPNKNKHISYDWLKCRW